jgi:TolB protein
MSRFTSAIRFAHLFARFACVVAVPFGVLHAQRRDVPLAQVKVPHSYYWREMYVPQVTTGPSSMSWSPDGKELVYSMQGTLWRQFIGSPIATQITSGRNYDFQPDWSPDGRSIVFSSYNGTGYALMMLDVPTGERRTLIEDGAVNIDARWSPDGSRLAWVSSAFNGRWHVFIARVAAGRLDSVARITEDRDGGLPRYYYSAFDHYLSPTWSPDGKELIVVSNRGRIYGTGGMWRMEARAGAPMREIHYEETTWKMRPDWHRDGKRVVFSSYHGRQWNQLWITRSEKADPMQLSYGEFDATVPRWSPDGSRIAFISNGAGNTALWTVTVPGGKRTRIDATTRRYREHVGQLIVTVVDSATRRPIPARVSVRDSTGKFYAPDNRWRHADEAVVRDAERFEYGYWHTTGVDTLSVPPGVVSVEIWHGPEWKTIKRTIVVRADARANARLTIAPLLPPSSSLRAAGWWSGDLHVHMNYGGMYRNTPARLAAQAKAEGLNVVENLIVNKEQRIPDINSWTTSALFSEPDLLIVNGQEFHTGLWGHTSQIGLRSHYLLPDYAGYPGTAFASLYPTNAAVFDMAHEQGALTGYVHPFDFAPDLNAIQGGIPYELPVDVAAGKVDFLEVMGYSDHLITSSVWYRLLNCGFRLPAGAGTDAFPNFSNLRGPPGLVRVFAKSGPTLNHRGWLAAIKAGRTMVTNAPIISLTVNGKDPGTEIRLPFAATNLSVRVTMKSAVPVNHLELVANGRVVAKLDGASDTTFTLAIDKPTWILARAYGDEPRLPVLDLYPFATTSPVYVTMGNAPVSCGADAEYFLGWLNILSQRVRTDANWNTPEEKEAALSLISTAHEEFIRRR